MAAMNMQVVEHVVEPDSPDIAPVDTKHGQKAQPTLPEMLSFRSKAKVINLAQQIGIKGKCLGFHLLEDDNGAIVDGIDAENRSVEDTNRDILKKWLNGTGVKPVTWSTLTNVMRRAGLFDLAAEVDEATNAEEVKVPSVLPSPFDYMDGPEDTVPVGRTLLCTAKAEYTQYPHGSRQDCWAIVSVKAARITTRQHVDIVAVIDNSGSMAGMKIQLVKETLLRLINLLDERDRIALLTYNTSVKQHFGLLEATAENKQIFKDAISSITAEGRTNLCDGLMKGVEILAYNGRTQSAPVQSVLLLSDGEATEGVKDREKILKEMNTVKCYSGSVYTFAFGNDCDYEMMEAIASHGKGVCYSIDSLEKIAPSFGDCLGGLKTTVAQNLSLHIEMQEDNRINMVHCDAVQWLVEDKICDIFIKDIQCGEQKCVALQLILSRLTEEKSETVLKGTLSFLDTGSSKDKLQDFQLHLKRYDGCCSEISNYQVDQQRNRVLAIGAINNLKRSGNCCKARNHISELINTIAVSVSHSSPWTQDLISDLKECMASLPEPSQDKQRKKHHKSKDQPLKPFLPKMSHSSQHEETNILLDPRAYEFSEGDEQFLSNSRVLAQGYSVQNELVNHSQKDTRCTSRVNVEPKSSVVPQSSVKQLESLSSVEQHAERCPTSKQRGSGKHILRSSSVEQHAEWHGTTKQCETTSSVEPQSSVETLCRVESLSGLKKQSRWVQLRCWLKQKKRKCARNRVLYNDEIHLIRQNAATMQEDLRSDCQAPYGRLKSFRHYSHDVLELKGANSIEPPESYSETISTPTKLLAISPKDCSGRVEKQSQEYFEELDECRMSFGEPSLPQISSSHSHHEITESSNSDSEQSVDSNEDNVLESSGVLAMLHALTQQRSNRVGARMYRTEAKDEMQRKILE